MLEVHWGKSLPVHNPEVENRTWDIPLMTTEKSVKHRSMVTQIANWLFTPVLTPVLHQLMIVRFLVIAAFFQIALTLFEIPAWRCPVHIYLKIPCPGCGLSEATASLVSGDWMNALHAHLFAPVVLMALLILGAFSMMPERMRQFIIDRTTYLERKTGFVVFILFLMLIYWGIRIMGLTGYGVIIRN